MRPVAVTLAAGVLVLAACGSESRVQTVPAPRLPASVASTLAARSDALASALHRRDNCSARNQVHALERQTREALASGRVPVVYRQRLLGAVTQLAGAVPACVQPPPPPPPPAPPAPPPHKPKHKPKPGPKPKPPKHHHDKPHGHGGKGR